MKWIGKFVFDYMVMGSMGGVMGGMEMLLFDNMLLMMIGMGLFGLLEMGGMFMVFKVW